LFEKGTWEVHTKLYANVGGKGVNTVLKKNWRSVGFQESEVEGGTNLFVAPGPDIVIVKRKTLQKRQQGGRMTCGSAKRMQKTGEKV